MKNKSLSYFHSGKLEAVKDLRKRSVAWPRQREKRKFRNLDQFYAIVRSSPISTKISEFWRFNSKMSDCFQMEDSLPEFEPEDPIPDLTVNYENQDLQIRRLRREQIALKGGETEEEKWLYGLLGSEMKILITDQRVLLGKCSQN